MAALHGAVALAEVHGGAVLVGEDLHLDVARTEDRLLEDELVGAERGACLGTRGLERRRELALLRDEPHPAPTAAGRGLHHDRVADRPGGGEEGRVALVALLVARHTRDTRGDHATLRRRLVAHERRWPRASGR